MPNQVEDKKKILLRVRKIKGQTQAIEKALEDNVTAPKASKVLAVADKLILPGVWRFTRLG